MSGCRRRVGYAQVLAVREFRALFAAYVLSLLGDQIAKVALAILVYDRSSSPALAALTYAGTYLTWVIAAPLSALGDRWPRRGLMVGCDLVRAALVAALLLPGMPLWALFVLTFAVSLLAPPAEAARAAIVPEVVGGEHYVLATSLTSVSNQLFQVAGFALGGLLVTALTARGALALDLASFLASALLLRTLVRPHSVAPAETLPPVSGPLDPPTEGPGPRTADGILQGVRVVFRDARLRALVLLAWTGSAFAVVPEGLALPYVRNLGGSDVAAGLLTAAAPAGAVLGVLVLARLVSPAGRVRLVLPLAVITTLLLVPTVLRPSLAMTMALWALAGAGNAYHLPANTLFMTEVPRTHRARAFGVAQGGLQVVQGVTIALAGVAAQWLAPAVVVALSGVLGTLAVLAVAARWPRQGGLPVIPSADVAATSSGWAGQSSRRAPTAAA